jgi:excinuclease ABC subunit A
MIEMRGVRTHNLHNLDVSIPRNQLVVITGLSGSGKSSLAFDTLYAEGQRRYVASLSAYARQFLSVMNKPEVDSIAGLSPAIAIEQKTSSHNPRSTVGTITEIADYLRLLYARVGEPHCPQHGGRLASQTVSQIVDDVLSYPAESAWLLLAPVVQDRKGAQEKVIEQLRTEGFIRVRLDGVVYDLDELPTVDPKKKHTIEAVIDRFKIKPTLSQRLAESIETAVALSNGLVVLSPMSTEDTADSKVYSTQFACRTCGYSLSEMEPRLFSFNSPIGACASCDGLGREMVFDVEKVIHNRELSLSAGAIRGWGRQHAHYYQLLESLAAHYEFSLEVPLARLPASILNMLLYGSGREKIKLTYLGFGRRRRREKVQPFEGIIPSMDRRYRQTDSQAVKDELSKYLSEQPCQGCRGTRLNPGASHVLLADTSLPTLSDYPIAEAMTFVNTLSLPGQRGEIADKIIREVKARLGFLCDVGLGYLSLSRSAETLSGGEAQRIRLASQIGSGLVGVMYILDEPSIGLHQRDNDRLLATLFHLRDLGNTVIVVEHDEEAIRQADHVIDIGPGAGKAGGRIVAEGTAQEIMQVEGSLTGAYLSGRREIAVPSQRLSSSCRPEIRIVGARSNNLQGIDVRIPLGLMTCVTGVSGSGKSSLINGTLYPAAAALLNRAIPGQIGDHDAIEGLSACDKVVDINQSPIGRTPRSNPATYTGLFTGIRELFAATPEARSRGYTAGRFSFNVKGGRCEACQGDGLIRVEMHFLADVYVACDVCEEKRYNRETLSVEYKGKNIHEVLSMTVETAREFFDAVPALCRKLQTLIDVGLSYITLGQTATSLSGGEAQRIKLAKELSKRSTGQTLYILDEPTTGLHFHDVQQLLAVLMRLRDQGNTIVVIEHNMDVIKVADWLIDLGPEGGSGGGQLVGMGSPEQLCKKAGSHTGRFLKAYLT